MMPDSPRKTRSRSRLVSGHRDDSNYLGSNMPPRLSRTPSLFIPAIPVMKASSMEPIAARMQSAEKRPRHKMTDLQLQKLEELYQANTHPSREAKAKLAEEVGMTLKSVLIWFQNRRQDRRRKKSGTGGPPAHARSASNPSRPRTSSAKTSPARTAGSGLGSAKIKMTPRGKAQAGSKMRSAPRLSDITARVRAHTDDSSLDLATSPTITGAHHSASRLQTYPTSSPCSSSSETLRSAGGSHRNAERSFGKHLYDDKSLPQSMSVSTPEITFAAPMHLRNSNSGNMISSGASSIPKPSLEWACAHSAARRKHGVLIYRDEDDSAGESSEYEAELAIGGYDHNYRRHPKRRRIGVQDIAVPREYQAIFEPDVVLGASLLLTLKYSADTL